MNTHKRNNTRVLAVDPTTKGFGFVVFEGPHKLIDWGTANVGRANHATCLKRIGALCERYTPAVLVVEKGKGSRRCSRVRRLLEDIQQLAAH